MPSISINRFFSKSEAYVIAIGKYLSESISDLETPLRDAAVLKGVLEKYHGFTVNDIHDAISQPDPTSTDVLNFLSNIKVDDNDRIIIYFACHGIAVDSD